MRVLYVIDSLARGGAEMSLVHIAPSYREVGLDLHIAFLRDHRDLGPALVEAGACLHPVEPDRGRLRQLAALIRLIRRLRPDVIHTTLWEADILGRTAGVLTWTPVVSTLATSENAPSPIANPGVRRWKLRLAHWVDIVTARAVRRFHAVSESVAERMALSLHVPRRRITVIPRARRRDLLGEPSTQRRQSVRTRLGLGDSVPVVLTVARHEHQKGLDVLVAATPTIRSSFPDVVVLVAGHRGRMSAALERSVAATGLDATIRILGDRDDVADLLVAADVVAVPSRVEGLPGAVLEAMALERPVVSSDLPTVREAIDDHAYAMVLPGDADALGRAVVRCLRDPARADKARAARQRFDELFSPSSVAARLRELYEDTLTSRFTAMGLRRRWTTAGRR